MCRGLLAVFLLRPEAIEIHIHIYIYIDIHVYYPSAFSISHLRLTCSCCLMARTLFEAHSAVCLEVLERRIDMFKLFSLMCSLTHMSLYAKGFRFSYLFVHFVPHTLIYDSSLLSCVVIWTAIRHAVSSTTNNGW